MGLLKTRTDCAELGGHGINSERIRNEGISSEGIRNEWIKNEGIKELNKNVTVLYSYKKSLKIKIILQIHNRVEGEIT